MTDQQPRHAAHITTNMELQNAHQIIDTLAQGIHPVTGEVLPEDSPYVAPAIIRALFVVSRALDDRRGPPAITSGPVAPLSNAGKPWSSEQDEMLSEAFVAGTEIRDIAAMLGRSPFGVEQRLIKLKFAAQSQASVASVQGAHS